MDVTELESIMIHIGEALNPQFNAVRFLEDVRRRQAERAYLRTLDTMRPDVRRAGLEQAFREDGGAQA